jgi:hypothetical protein
MVPTDEFPPRTPETIQLTEVLVVPATAAANCCDPSTCKVALLGEIEIETETVAAGMIETAALAEADDWYALCAVTVIGPDGTPAGALYMPAEEIVPTTEFPPKLPLTNQLMEVLLVPETVAPNCCDWPACKLDVLGDIVTVTTIRL